VKISTLKVIVFGFATMLLMAMGLGFAAAFAMDELQSWPKALMEARGVVYGQILLGVSFGFASQRWQRKVESVLVVATLISLGGFVWSLSATPPDGRFGVILWGVTSLVLLGGAYFGEFVRATRESYRGRHPSNKSWGRTTA